MLGVALSLVAREHGRSVLVARLRDDERAEADTLRAHGVLHSGLLYAQTNRALARQIRYQGERLLARAGMSLPTERGIYVLGSEEHAEQFQRSAIDLKIGSQIRRLADAELRKRVRPFYSAGFPAFEVPDAPFPSGELLDDLRDAAREAGAIFVELDDEVSVRADSTHENGFFCHVSGKAFSASNVILAAGARLPQLLDSLGIKHPLAVFRTPVLRVDGGAELDTPLFADFRPVIEATGTTAPLFVTRYRPDAVPPNGCLVFAGSRKLLSNAEATQRVVGADQQSFLDGRVPVEYRRAPRRWWAGHKVEPRGSLADHWLLMPAEHHYKGLFAAVPGKATMALSVADDVFQLVEAAPQRDVTTRDFRSVDAIVHQAWNTPVRMMHDNYYNHVDEREADPPRASQPL
jgi:glycine/D-amino acid oxidase-like deaminating enzyme